MRKKKGFSKNNGINYLTFQILEDTLKKDKECKEDADYRIMWEDLVTDLRTELQNDQIQFLFA